MCFHSAGGSGFIGDSKGVLLQSLLRTDVAEVGF